MEKQRNNSNSKSCNRLLKVFSLLILSSAFFTQNIFSQNKYYAVPSQSSLNELRIQASDNQNFYTKTDIKFEILIPDVPSSIVQVQSPENMTNVTFNTLRKSESYGYEQGTKIELWFNFAKKGEYELSPLVVMIDSRRRLLKFNKLIITDNPDFLLPRIVLDFNGEKIYSDDDYSKPVLTATTGVPLTFTVNLQYATQLVQFSWDIPKNSIFKQTQEYEFTEIKYREKKVSEDLIPVAAFEWTGLQEGLLTIPEMKLLATGYNGYKNELILPPFQINFVKDKSSENLSEEVQKEFEDAFNENYAYDDKNVFMQITNEDCKTLAYLRNQEAHLVFNHAKTKKVRKDFEESFGIQASRDEFYNGFCYLSLIFFAVSVLFLVILLKKRNIPFCILTILLVMISLSFLFFCIVQKENKYAVCKGTILRAIPESKASSIAEIKPLSRVQITEESGDWCYIEIDDSEGWVLKNKLEEY